LSKDYTNLIALDARVLLMIDTHLKRAIRKFLPPSLATRMNFVNMDFAADRMPAAGIIALMLSDDKSEGYMTAKSDRAELDKALDNVKLTKDMSIEHFRVLYQNAVEDYNDCSAIKKWVATQEGHEEQIEFLLHLLGEGKLKESMSTKFDKLRSAAELDDTERPGLDKFWELLTRVHAVSEHHKLRSITNSNPNKRQRDEQITTLNIDSGSQPLHCFKFQQGKCTRGSSCGFSHTTEPTVKKAQFAILGGKGKGRFKGSKGKPVHEVNIPFKGSKGSKGSRGKGKGKGNHKGDGKGKGTRDSQLVYCGRCESSHHGATGRMCVMPPCRYCLSTKAKSTNHHLKDCRQRPAKSSGLLEWPSGTLLCLVVSC
jgi:hypothetical protein